MDEVKVLWEDGDVLAVDKPAGVVSSPRWSQDGGCLPTLLERMGYGRVYIVHRLDKPVSGVMLYARSRRAHSHLNQQFSQRKVAKRYAALVHGQVGRSSGVIDAPIRQFGSGRMGVDVEKGVESRTRFEVLRRLPESSLLHVSPETGRRHQIRVHLYSIGHAIVGDRRYGDIEAQAAYPRLMLHATEIRFTLPSGLEQGVRSALPVKFQGVVDMLFKDLGA
jgi:RluA family pseudouridine synthase